MFDRYAHLFPSVEEALAEQLGAIYEAGQAAEPSKVVELKPLVKSWDY